MTEFLRRFVELAIVQDGIRWRKIGFLTRWRFMAAERQTSSNVSASKNVIDFVIPALDGNEPERSPYQNETGYQFGAYEPKCLMSKPRYHCENGHWNNGMILVIM